MQQRQATGVVETPLFPGCRGILRRNRDLLFNIRIIRKEEGEIIRNLCDTAHEGRDIENEETKSRCDVKGPRKKSCVKIHC
jgi:hypothetical protein